MISKDQKREAYHWLIQQTKISRTFLTAKVVVSYFSSILLIIQSALIAKLIHNTIIKHQVLNQCIVLIIGLIFIMVLRATISFGQELLGFHTGAKIRTVVRENYLKTLHHIGPIPLIQQHSAASSSVFIEQIEALQNFYANYLPQITLAIIIPLTLLIVIFPVDWLAGLVLLITAPLIPLFMALIGMGVESANQRHFKSLALLSADFLDKLRGLITLKLFNQSKKQTSKIEKVADDYRQQTMSVLKVAFLSSGALELFSSASIAIVAIILGLTLLNEITIGYFHTFTLEKALFILLLAPEFFFPLRQLGVYYHSRAEAIAAAITLLKFFSKEDSSILNSKNQHSKELMIGSNFSLEFKNISFSYPNKPKLFDQFNLLIKSKEKVAIIGSSGVGKSTIINLLMGFLHPQIGEILLNQKNIAHFDLIHWHQQIAFLGQTPQLFHGTIKSNIQFAKPTASNAEIIAAAKKAGVMDFINEFPLGLETQIAEQNLGLSGGQAQRVALARIFLADRPITILDEPTANLDEKTEQQIIQSFKDHLIDKTVILITHRQETSSFAERVIYL